MLDVGRKKEIDPTFGRRLRALRNEKGWTLAQLGTKAGMAYQDVARLERAEREPTWGTILKLAGALDVSLDEFKDDSAGEPDAG